MIIFASLIVNKKMMEDKEILFRQKAMSYLCCFNAQCPRREQCLRWEVGQYVDPEERTCHCVNPRYRLAQQGQCDLFRDNRPVLMHVGMKEHFYRDMPTHVERQIKARLIGGSCRSTYYKYHSGLRPIDPAMLAVIEEACREAGWTAPLRFDSEVEDYDW